MKFAQISNEIEQPLLRYSDLKIKYLNIHHLEFDRTWTLTIYRPRCPI